MASERLGLRASELPPQQSESRRSSPLATPAKGRRVRSVGQAKHLGDALEFANRRIALFGSPCDLQSHSRHAQVLTAFLRSRRKGSSSKIEDPVADSSSPAPGDTRGSWTQ